MKHTQGMVVVEVVSYTYVVKVIYPVLGTMLGAPCQFSPNEQFNRGEIELGGCKSIQASTARTSLLPSSSFTCTLNIYIALYISLFLYSMN